MKLTPETERQFDADLLSRVATGDERAFGEFYDRYSPRLYALAAKIMNDPKEAEDVLQEGFAYMWRKAATYDIARSSAFTWAVMIMRNKAIDRLRVRQRIARIVEKATAEVSEIDDVDHLSAAEPDMRDERARIRSALEKIPEDQRQAVELAFFSGLTHEQIAERLGTPLGTIKARIRRGLLRLRDFLKGEL